MTEQLRDRSSHIRIPLLPAMDSVRGRSIPAGGVGADTVSPNRRNVGLRARMTRWAVIGGLVFVAILFGSLTSAGAQEVAVRFEGRVLWISGQTMLVALDDGRTVSIDLARVAQSDYRVLAQNDFGQNDWVVVDAVRLRGSRRVIATSVQRLGRYPESP